MLGRALSRFCSSCGKVDCFSQEGSARAKRMIFTQRATQRMVRGVGRVLPDDVNKSQVHKISTSACPLRGFYGPFDASVDVTGVDWPCYDSRGGVSDRSAQRTLSCPRLSIRPKHPKQQHAVFGADPDRISTTAAEALAS